MRVKLKSTTLLATWTWSFPAHLTHNHDRDSLCGICRVQFDGTCPTCRIPGDDCPLLIGKCQHAFHMHCLSMWVQQESSRGLCPMCRQKFEWKKEENLAAVRSGGMRGIGGVGSPERGDDGNGAENGAGGVGGQEQNGVGAAATG